MLIRLVLLISAAAGAALILAGQWGLLRGKAPSDLGVSDGRLKPPSQTENSVSSQASLYPEHPMRTYAEIAPLSYTGDAALAWSKLEQAVAALPRTSIITNATSPSGRYLYAQSTTLLLRFTDDVEFWQDPANHVIHVRSSSRLGRKDFGVNRARIEAVRTAFHAT
ncbi:MAG: DUF1499 domain-containing protein [Cytophagales bacterium]|nr:DUF1499 domain-containing protein [Cytophagales bacterium]